MLFILLAFLALAEGNPIDGLQILTPISPVISAPILSKGITELSGWGNKGIEPVVVANPILSGGLPHGSGWNSKGIASLGYGLGGKGIGSLGNKWVKPALVSVPVGIKAPIAIAPQAIGWSGIKEPLGLKAWSGQGGWGGKWN